VRPQIQTPVPPPKKQKTKKKKPMMWAGVVTQVVELLPSKLKALSSNPSNGKKKKNHTVPILYSTFKN
jgi:hypothetical protein